MVELPSLVAPSVSAAPHGIRTAVAGVGGYAGGELARLLLAHPRLANSAPLFLGRSTHEADTPLEQLHPQLARGSAQPLPPVHPFHWDLIEQREIDLIFLALPHETSRELAPLFLARGIKVIDLSGAWRLHDSTNSAVYALQHIDNAADPALAVTLQAKAIYGAPELHRNSIRNARLVANPGCYATSIILALAPLLAAGLVNVQHGIICDSKSGVSGAGKSPSANTHFMHAADNLSAYSVFGHRHTGELLEQLHLTSDQIQFTPHLLPIPRGILSTIYLRLKQPTQPTDVQACLQNFYATSPMVRIHQHPSLPQIQHVVRTGYCDIGFALAPDGQRLVLISCLDNLLKGASSQAIQNMNLMCDWAEQEGLV